MSGFIGIYHFDGAPAERDWLQKATNFMAFRGPDAQAIWSEGPVGLGHALLRTTFEAQGEAQPVTLDGKAWIAADVRLDGRSELIRLLRQHGCQAADSIPDVELVLHAYRVWGTACIEHLMGDFAFALWDGGERRFFCGRDHFGVAPFFYAQVNDTLLVSNTLDALRLHPAVSNRLDEQAIGDNLLFGMYQDPQITIYSDLHRLPPAHTLTAQGREVQLRRYWQPEEGVESLRTQQPQEVVERFKALFEQAVSDRLRSDRVGTALSGGLDSTSIAATAQRLLQARRAPFSLRAATIVYERLISDHEGEFAQQVAEASGFTTKRYTAEEYIQRQPDFAPAHLPPEPWVVTGTTAEEAIQTDMAREVQVYLMGFGGDPLLAPPNLSWLKLLNMGYPRLALGMLRRRARAWRRRIFEPELNFNYPPWLITDFAARSGLKDRWEIRIKGQNHLDQQQVMAFAPLWEAIFRSGDPGFSGLPLKINWPFFDLRLYEFMRTVPGEPWRRKKYLLREAMRGVLPEAVRTRPKTILPGNPHLNLYHTRGAPAWMGELASLPELAPYIDQKRLLNLIEQPQKIGLVAFGQFMSVLPLACWLRQHCRERGG
jgi:asparagine synthase (glutamine-hydrolysing)